VTQDPYNRAFQPLAVSNLASVGQTLIPSVPTTFEISFYGPSAWPASGLLIYADETLVGSGSDWGYPLDDPFGVFTFTYHYNEYDRYRVIVSRLPFAYSTLTFKLYAYRDQAQSPGTAYLNITSLSGGAPSAPQSVQSQSDWPLYTYNRPDPRLAGKHLIDMIYTVDTKSWSTT
jgi:hypothetical protein